MDPVILPKPSAKEYGGMSEMRAYAVERMRERVSAPDKVAKELQQGAEQNKSQQPPKPVRWSVTGRGEIRCGRNWRTSRWLAPDLHCPCGV